MSRMPATASPSRLTDTVFLESSCKVDRDGGLIEGVRVLGRHSKNGRKYTDQAMHDAAALYEGLRCNYDHPPQHNARQERLFGEFAGILEGCRFDKRLGEVRGNLRVATQHRDSGLLMEAAEKFPRTFGLSHNADGEVRHQDGKQIVESLSHVESVDIVTRPATNQGLFESEGNAMNTVAREVVGQSTGTDKGKQLLLEVSGEYMAPENAGNEASPEEIIKSGVLSAIKAKLSDADEASLKKVLKILGINNEVTAAMNGALNGNNPEEETADEGAAEPATPEEEVEEPAVAESRRTNMLAAKLAILEAKTMLLEAGREATEERVAAVASVNESRRNKLVESWPVHASLRRTKPATSGRREAPAYNEVNAISDDWQRRLDLARNL